MDEERTRLQDVWWCEECVEVHLGDLMSWNMEHRNYIHPVYAIASRDRPFLTPMGLGPSPDL